MQKENIAKKWNQYPKRAEAFFSWMKLVRSDLIEDPLKALGIDELKRKYSDVLGEAPVRRAIKSLGHDAQSAVKQKNLYSAGLTTGLTNSSAEGSKQIKEHTFYGKKIL